MKSAKLFVNGRSQAVRLPKEFRFDGSEVFIRRCGNIVELIPRNDAWVVFSESLDEFTSDFMSEGMQPRPEERESMRWR